MATETSFKPLKGHCTCKAITYEILAPFLCTNCCHCTWCQRESGSAFALNSIIETSNFRITSKTKPIHINIPSASGGGQMIARCPTCYVGIYGDYGADDGAWWTFIRAGTLDEESKRNVKPDVHVFTSTKLDFVDLSGEKERGVPILEGMYEPSQVWRKDAMERLEVLNQQIEKVKKSKEGVEKGKEESK